MKLTISIRPPFVIWTLLLTLTLTAFGLNSLALGSRGNRPPQSEKKALKIKYDNLPDAPHRIEDIEIDGIIADQKPSQQRKYVETNHKLERKSDWVKKLKFKYTNTTNQDIVFLNVTLLLQHPTEPDTKLSPTIFSYVAGTISANLAPLPPIRSGQTITIQMKETNYYLLKKMCDENGLKDLDTIDEAVIDVYQTFFADGSMWMYGAYFDPDPNNPQQRIRRP